MGTGYPAPPPPPCLPTPLNTGMILGWFGGPVIGPFEGGSSQGVTPPP